MHIPEEEFVTYMYSKLKSIYIKEIFRFISFDIYSTINVENTGNFLSYDSRSSGSKWHLTQWTCFATTALLVTGSNPTGGIGNSDGWFGQRSKCMVLCALQVRAWRSLYEVHVSRCKPNYHAEIEAVNLSCQPKIYAFESPE